MSDTVDTLTVAPTMTVSQFATVLAVSKRKASAVVENKSNNRIIGIVSARDVLVRVLAAGKNPEKTLVQDFMTKSPTTVPLVHYEYNPDEARKIMVEHGFRHMPVVQSTQSASFVRMLNIMDEAQVWYQRASETSLASKMKTLGSSFIRFMGLVDSDDENESEQTDAELQDIESRTRAMLKWRINDLWPATSTESMLCSNSTLNAAVHHMARHKVGCTLVHNPENPYSVAGVITETDIVIRALGSHGSDQQVLERPISDFWTTGKIASLDGSATLGEALNLMLRNGYRHIPVVQQDTGLPTMILDIVTLLKVCTVGQRSRSLSTGSIGTEFEDTVDNDVLIKNELDEGMKQSVGPTAILQQSIHDQSATQTQTHDEISSERIPANRSSITNCSRFEELWLDKRVFGHIQRIHDKLDAGRSALRSFDFYPAIRKFEMTVRLMDPILQSALRTYEKEATEDGAILLAIVYCMRANIYTHLARAKYIALASCNDIETSATTSMSVEEPIQHAKEALQAHTAYSRIIRKAHQLGFTGLSFGENYVLHPKRNEFIQNVEDVITEDSQNSTTPAIQIQAMAEDANIVLQLDQCDFLLYANEFEQIHQSLKSIDISSFPVKPCKASAATQTKIRQLIALKAYALIETAHQSQVDAKEEIFTAQSMLSVAEKEYLLTKAMRAVGAARNTVEALPWILEVDSDISELFAHDKETMMRAKQLYGQLQPPHEMHLDRARQTLEECGIQLNSLQELNILQLVSKSNDHAAIRNAVNDCLRAKELASCNLESYVLLVCGYYLLGDIASAFGTLCEARGMQHACLSLNTDIEHEVSFTQILNRWYSILLSRLQHAASNEKPRTKTMTGITDSNSCNHSAENIPPTSSHSSKNNDSSKDAAAEIAALQALLGESL